MLEVYSGSKPGRPALLLACTALMLLAALALAGLQVRDTRRLGEAVRIPGTPLIVRPPRGWHADPRDPATFVRTVHVERWGRAAELVERQLRFHYQRWQTFQPTPVLLRRRNFMESYAHLVDGRAAPVGPLDGVQVVRARQFKFGGATQAGSMVYRLAMSPRGEEINVEYIPLTDMAPGDVDLLDEICAHVEIDDPLLSRGAGQIMAAARVDFPLAPSWRVFPPDLPEVQGLYVQGDRGGVPVWAIGLFRTWIASDRTPEQVLASFAETHWTLDAADVHVDQRRGDDGTVYALAANQPPADDPTLMFPRLVVRDGQHAALLFAMCDPDFAGEAEAAVDAIAQGLHCDPAPWPADIGAAEDAGRRLAAALGAGELRWTQPDEAEFWGETIQPPYWRQAPRIVSEERARAADGWRGQREYGRIAPDSGRFELEREEEWFLADDGRSFALQVEESGQRGGPTISEQRRAGAAEIERTVTIGRSARSFSTAVGEAYVPPPAEGLVEARLAADSAAPADAIVEVSNLNGRSTVRRWMERLPPESGQRRVLLLDDYFPRGVVVWYDDQGRMMAQEDPGRRLERSDMATIRSRMEDWRRRP